MRSGSPWYGAHGWTSHQKHLDGARVLAFSVIDGAVTPTGGTTHRIEDEVLGPAAGLAITRYDGDEQFYLFYCDPMRQVVTDTCHPSLQGYCITIAGIPCSTCNM